MASCGFSFTFVVSETVAVRVIVLSVLGDFNFR